MAFERLLAEERIQPYVTGPEQIGGMLQAARRDLRDAILSALSVDRRFAIAYQAALGAARVVMVAHGYRPTGPAQHATVFSFLEQIDEPGLAAVAPYFDRCRIRRHRIDYERVDVVSETEAKQLLEEARQFLDAVLEWLRRNHPTLLVDT